MAELDLAKFKISDLQSYLDLFSNPTLSLDKMKLILQNLWIVALQSDDTRDAMLAKKAVPSLLGLCARTTDHVVKAEISGILALLGHRSDHSVNLVFDGLANIFLDAEFNVFIEGLSGLKEIISASNISDCIDDKNKKKDDSCSCSSGSGGEGEISPAVPVYRHGLSVHATCAILSKLTAVLKSTTLSDSSKTQALDLFVNLADSFIFNETAEFWVWLKANSKKKNATVPLTTFFVSFSAFFEVLKEVSTAKKRSALSFLAEIMCNKIADNTVFLPAISPSVAGVTTLLPMKFIAVSSPIAGITFVPSKIVWTSQVWATFGVDQKMENGKYRIEIESDCASNNMSHVYLGLCATTQLAAVSTVQGYNKAGTCFFSASAVYVGGSAVHSGTVFDNVRTHLFGLELDVDKRILTISVDGLEVPHAVGNIPDAVCFAVCGVYPSQVFEIKSFQKLTVSPTACHNENKVYPWK